MAKQTDDLDARIKREAAERAQKAVNTFKVACALSAAKLLNGIPSAYLSSDFDVFWKILASPDKSKGWPQVIWDFHEKQVLDEVMATMNAVQRLFVNKPSVEIVDTPKESSV